MTWVNNITSVFFGDGGVGGVGITFSRSWIVQTSNGLTDAGRLRTTWEDGQMRRQWTVQIHEFCSTSFPQQSNSYYYRFIYSATKCCGVTRRVMQATGIMAMFLLFLKR